MGVAIAVVVTIVMNRAGVSFFRLSGRNAAAVPSGLLALVPARWMALGYMPVAIAVMIPILVAIMVAHRSTMVFVLIFVVVFVFCECGRQQAQREGCQKEKSEGLHLYASSYI